MTEPLALLLGSKARLKILRLFVFNNESVFTPAEVVLRTNVSKEVVRKELSELSKIGFILKKGVSARLRYQINPRFEYKNALDTFIRDTSSVNQKNMTTALRRAGTLRLVALSGIFMDVLESQIDILIVGDRLDERLLATIIHSFEAELGREIRYAAFTTEDFRYRHGIYDRLFRDVFDYPHRLFVDKIGL